MPDHSTPGDAQLPHLDTFSKAAELNSFTGAARALHLTQAAVSQRIGALEKAVRASLFQRRGGRVLLTEAGRRLYGFAQRILDLHREAWREVAGGETPLAGELLLAASSIPGEYFLPGLLSTFHQRHPLVRIQAAVSDSMQVMAEVEHGKVQVGLVGRKAENPHLDFRFLARDRMVLVVPRGHVLSKRKKISVRQLAEHPLVLREAGSGLRHCFEKSLERAGRSMADLQVTLELGSNESVKEAVLQGVGVAILSIHAVHREIEAGRLHSLAVHDLQCDRDTYVVLDRRRVLPPPARQFLIFLESNPIPLP